MADLLSEVRKHMALLSDPTKAEHHDSAYDALIGHVTARPAAHDEDRTAKVRALRAAIIMAVTQFDSVFYLLCIDFRRIWLRRCYMCKRRSFLISVML